MPEGVRPELSLPVLLTVVDEQGGAWLLCTIECTAAQVLVRTSLATNLGVLFLAMM